MPGERLEAVVIALDRKEDELEGRVRMKTFIDGRPVSVRTTLPYQLYTIAWPALRGRAASRASG